MGMKKGDIFYYVLTNDPVEVESDGSIIHDGKSKDYTRLCPDLIGEHANGGTTYLRRFQFNGQRLYEMFQESKNK